MTPPLGQEPAFPCAGAEGVNPESIGMSTRTWLAGTIAAGYAANSTIDAGYNNVATSAVIAADRILALLARSEPPTHTEVAPGSPDRS